MNRTFRLLFPILVLTFCADLASAQSGSMAQWLRRISPGLEYRLPLQTADTLVIKILGTAPNDTIIVDVQNPVAGQRYRFGTFAARKGYTAPTVRQTEDYQGVVAYDSTTGLLNLIIPAWVNYQGDSSVAFIPPSTASGGSAIIDDFEIQWAPQDTAFRINSSLPIMRFMDPRVKFYTIQFADSLIGTGSGAGLMKLGAASGNGFAGFRGPTSSSATMIWNLPAADGTAGQAWLTDGAGNMYFGSVAGSASPFTETTNRVVWESTGATDTPLVWVDSTEKTIMRPGNNDSLTLQGLALELKSLTHRIALLSDSTFKIWGNGRAKIIMYDRRVDPPRKLTLFLDSTFAGDTTIYLPSGFAAGGGGGGTAPWILADEDYLGKTGGGRVALEDSTTDVIEIISSIFRVNGTYTSSFYSDPTASNSATNKMANPQTGSKTGVPTLHLDNSGQGSQTELRLTAGQTGGLQPFITWEDSSSIDIFLARVPNDSGSLVLSYAKGSVSGSYDSVLYSNAVLALRFNPIGRKIRLIANRTTAVDSIGRALQDFAATFHTQRVISGTHFFMINADSVLQFSADTANNIVRITAQSGYTIRFGDSTKAFRVLQGIVTNGGDSIREYDGPGLQIVSGVLESVLGATVEPLEFNGTLGADKGGSGLVSPTANRLMLTNGASAFQLIAPTTANRVVRSDGTTWAASQVALATDVSGTLPVANGGLNTSTAPTTAQIPIAGGTTSYTPQTVSGDITINSSGVTAIGASKVTTSMVATDAIDSTKIPASGASMTDIRWRSYPIDVTVWHGLSPRSGADTLRALSLPFTDSESSPKTTGLTPYIFTDSSSTTSTSYPMGTFIPRERVTVDSVVPIYQLSSATGIVVDSVWMKQPDISTQGTALVEPDSLGLGWNIDYTGSTSITRGSALTQSNENEPASATGILPAGAPCAIVFKVTRSSNDRAFRGMRVMVWVTPSPQ